LFSVTICNAQLCSIHGYAPEYSPGEKVRLYRFQDLITQTTEEIASTKVQKDSTFTLHFYFSGCEKIKIQIGLNYGFIYVQPEGNYEIFFPIKNKYDASRDLGNEVELNFKNLDSTDINYKILQFNSWENYFLGNFYAMAQQKGVEFSKHLDTFKLNVQNYYQSDTNRFLKTYIKYRIADLDEINFTGSRNVAEKFDHYLRLETVHYHNEPYMDYISRFFEDFFEHAAPETNNRIYLAILKSSPTQLLNAMGLDYRMKNLRLRELIMIKSLGESYFSSDFPQTNIKSILDSLSHKTLFKDNLIIAQNVLKKISYLSVGATLPPIFLKKFDGTNYEIPNNNKYTYLQFIDFDNEIDQKELELTLPLFKKYQGKVNFVTVFIQYKSPIDETLKENLLQTYPWALVVPSNDFDLMQTLNIKSLPHYQLLNPKNEIYQNPALRPTPNGEYITIDKTFYELMLPSEKR
jgi:hypothetical protein